MQLVQHRIALLVQQLAVVRLRDPAFVAATQVGDEGLLVGLRVMDQAAQRIQPSLLEAVEHHVERGTLLADEQDALATSSVVRDQIGNGL
ncbi:hypothetical protein D3C71_1895330 [compost metagenome]